MVANLNLYSKMACEQEEEILRCAESLRQEFNFPEETLPEFDKLVRLGIQSARRNRKRSQKRMMAHQDQQSRKMPKTDPHIEESNFLGSMFDYDKQSDMSTGTSETSPMSPQPVLAKKDDSRLAIDSLVAPLIHDVDRLPSIRKLTSNPEFEKASAEILSLIKRSKTCFDISGAGGLGGGSVSSRGYEQLEDLGSSCISAGVLYTLQKWFDHLSPDSSSYIRLRLKSDLTLSLIIKNLAPGSNEVVRLSDYIAAQLFKKLLGGCTKDFGFDSVLLPLCQVFRGIISRDFPLLSKETKLHQQTQQNQQLQRQQQQQSQQSQMMSQQMSQQVVLPPILPPIGRDILSVVVRYGSRELKFAYSSHNNAPPTLLELITNGRSAFGIVGSDRRLVVRNRGRQVCTDVELTKIFRESRSSVDLELVAMEDRFLSLASEERRSSPEFQKLL